MAQVDEEEILAEVLYRTSMHAATFKSEFTRFEHLNEDVRQRWRHRAQIFMAHYARTITERKSDEQIREETLEMAREMAKTKTQV